MIVDKEQKFVFTTGLWRQAAERKTSELIQQGYLQDHNLILSLVKNTNHLNELVERGYFNPVKKEFNFADGKLTCRIRRIKARNQDAECYELTIKLYDDNKSKRLRQKYPADSNIGCTALEQNAFSKTRFYRHHIYHGHDLVDGVDQSLKWKVDNYQDNLQGLTLAKTESLHGFVSCIECPCENAKSVTNNRQFTGIQLGQVANLQELDIHIHRRRKRGLHPVLK